MNVKFVKSIRKIEKSNVNILKLKLDKNNLQTFHLNEKGERGVEDAVGLIEGEYFLKRK